MANLDLTTTTTTDALGATITVKAAKEQSGGPYLVLQDASPGRTLLISVVPVLTVTTYVNGNSIGGLMQFDDAGRFDNTGGELRELRIYSNTARDGTDVMDLYLFETKWLTAPGNNVAFSVSGMPKPFLSEQLIQWVQEGGISRAYLRNLNYPYTCLDSGVGALKRAVWMYAVCRSTDGLGIPAAAVNDLTFAGVFARE